MAWVNHPLAKGNCNKADNKTSVTLQPDCWILSRLIALWRTLTEMRHRPRTLVQPTLGAMSLSWWKGMKELDHSGWQAKHVQCELASWYKRFKRDFGNLAAWIVDRHNLNLGSSDHLVRQMAHTKDTHHTPRYSERFGQHCELQGHIFRDVHNIFLTSFLISIIVPDISWPITIGRNAPVWGCVCCGKAYPRQLFVPSVHLRSIVMAWTMFPFNAGTHQGQYIKGDCIRHTILSPDSGGQISYIYVDCSVPWASSKVRDRSSSCLRECHPPTVSFPLDIPLHLGHSAGRKRQWP